MGLFDWVTCEYPLPGNPPECAVNAAYQTKDLTCWMMNYTITADGKLIESKGEEDWSFFTGTIDLGWSNVVASGPGIYTADGENAVYLEYRVTFVNGVVASFLEVENRSEPAAKRKVRVRVPGTPEEISRSDQRRSESLVGRAMCVWWGGDSSDGYPVTVVYETERELVCRNEHGKLELIGRYQRDNCLFDSYEDGKRHKDERKAAWDAERVDYEREIAGKTR